MRIMHQRLSFNIYYSTHPTQQAFSVCFFTIFKIAAAKTACMSSFCNFKKNSNFTFSFRFLNCLRGFDTQKSFPICIHAVPKHSVIKISNQP